MRLLIIFLFATTFFASGCIESQHEDDLLLIMDYINDNNLNNVQSTESGLHYIIQNEGTGGNPPANADVTVLYRGTLLDGSVFDETTGTPRTFELPFLIQGWREGLQLMQKGGEATLMIPSRLGYGSSARPGIPRNSVLIFDITLVDWN